MADENKRWGAAIYYGLCGFVLFLMVVWATSHETIYKIMRPGNEPARGYRTESRQIKQRDETKQLKNTLIRMLLRDARMALIARDYEKARDLAEQILQADARNASAYQVRGVAYWGQKKPEQALENLSKSIQLNPKSSTVYMQRAAVYIGTQKYEQAILDLSKTIELRPSMIEAYIGRGNCYRWLGNLDKALQNYRLAIKRSPDYAQAYYEIGNVYTAKKEYNQAIQEFSKAIELQPNKATDIFMPHMQRGLAFLKINRLDRAVEDLSKAIELQPTNGLALYYRGTIYKQQGQGKLAKQDFHKAGSLGVSAAYQQDD